MVFLKQKEVKSILSNRYVCITSDALYSYRAYDKYRNRLHDVERYYEENMKYLREENAYLRRKNSENKSLFVSLERERIKQEYEKKNKIISHYVKQSILRRKK